MHRARTIPASTFVTGQSIAIDGGSFLQKSVPYDIAKHAPTTRYDGFHRSEDWAGTPFEALGGHEE